MKVATGNGVQAEKATDSSCTQDACESKAIMFRSVPLPVGMSRGATGSRSSSSLPNPISHRSACRDQGGYLARETIGSCTVTTMRRWRPIGCRTKDSSSNASLPDGRMAVPTLGAAKDRLHFPIALAGGDARAALDLTVHGHLENRASAVRPTASGRPCTARTPPC